MMTKQQTYKSPSQFVKGEKQPPKSPQNMGGKQSIKNQMAKKKTAHKMCTKCKGAHKTSEHKMKHKVGMKMTPASKGHKPNGAHGRAAVKALGRAKTTGNFDKIEKSKGKGAAISAYQNALKSHKAHKATPKTGKQLLGRAMKKLNKRY